MELQDVIRKRRMVRTYDLSRPIPRAIINRLLENAVRAPSAGFSQGWAFLVLDDQDDIGKFRRAVTPEQDAEGWLAANVAAPLIIVPMSNREVYLDRYAEPEKGHTDRDTSWWPAPYWDIDTGMATMSMLLTAVDQGIGACFFGIPRPTYPSFRAAFGVPDAFTPIGAVSFGHSDEPAHDLRARRRRTEEVVHWRRWAS
jgi:nitroreductase